MTEKKVSAIEPLLSAIEEPLLSEGKAIEFKKERFCCSVGLYLLLYKNYPHASLASNHVSTPVCFLGLARSFRLLAGRG